jgi:hypothetical protein
MSGGLLDGLNDPKLMAEIAQRQRIAERIAEQMGVTRQEARQLLVDFEAVTSSEGEALH